MRRIHLLIMLSVTLIATISVTSAAEGSEGIEASIAYARALGKRLQDGLVYPEEMRTAGIHGTTTIAFEVAEDGALHQETLKVAKSSGFPSLDASALSAASSSAPFEKPPRKMTIQIAMAFLALPRLPDGVSEKAIMSNGTGFFVNSSGTVVTARHVVETCRQILVMKDRTLYPVQVMVLSRTMDLALLKTAIGVAEPAVFAVDKTLHDGEPVFFLGDNDLRTTRGGRPITSNGFIADDQAGASTAPLFSLTGNGVPGYSGSPVLDSNGHVIGMIVAKQALAPKKGSISDFISDVRSATPMAIKTFLDSEGVAYKESNMSAQNATMQQVVANRISAGVICR